MAIGLLALSSIVGIVNLVAFIIVLIQLFKAKGPGMGILGLCCGLYTFIWGWQNVGALDANNPPVIVTYRQWMMIWSVCIGLGLLFNLMGRAMMPSGSGY